MTLKGRPLSEEQKQEIRRAYEANKGLRGYRYRDPKTMRGSYERDENPTPYSKSGVLRGSMRSH